MTTAAALAELRTAYEAFLAAVERVRLATVAEAGQGNGPLEIANIQRIVAAHHGYSARMLASRDKHAPVALARHTAIWLCRELTDHGLETIGRAFGRHHTGICYATQKFADRLSVDRKLAAQVAELRAAVLEALAK